MIKEMEDQQTLLASQNTPAPGSVGGSIGALVLPVFSSDGYEYYRYADVAAIKWAQKEGYALGQKDASEKETEWASLIFEKKDEGGVPYYSYTKPDKLKSYLKRYSAPGPDAKPEKYHGKLPSGATLVGYIHLHWQGSEHLHPSNVSFSDGDNDRGDRKTMADFPSLKFYILGSTGVLTARNPENMPPNRPDRPYDTDAKREYNLATNVYGPGPMQLTVPFRANDLLPCYLK